MSILVTGAGGQLGMELCRQLGEEATGVDRDSLDLTDSAAIGSFFSQHEFAKVINTAAYTQVDQAETQQDLCLAINTTAVEHLAAACQAQGALFVQISTDYVFGGDAARSVPYTEDDLPQPVGVYAQSKAAAEQLAATADRHLIARSCGLYGRPGPQTLGSNFVDTMLRLGREREHLRVVNDQHCNPSYVPHVAKALIELIASGCTGTYHVVNSGETTWFDFAREIFRQAKIQVNLEAITTDQYPAAAPRPRYSVLDQRKTARALGRALPHWSEALAEYLSTRDVV